jgi:O-antigen ligase
MVARSKAPADLPSGPAARDGFASVARTLALLTVVLAPLPLGSNRPLFWSVAGVVLGLALAGTGLHLLRSGRHWPKSLTFPAVAFSIVIAWMAVQALPFLPAMLHHPSWAAASDLPGGGAGGSIGASPLGAVDSIIRWAGFAAVFLATTLTVATPAEARRAMTVIVLGGAAVAAASVALRAIGADTYGVPRWAYPDLLAGPFVNPNTFATWLGIVTVATLAGLLRFPAEAATEVSARRRDRRAILFRVFYTVAFMVLLLALAMTGSRAGAAATAAGILTVLVVHVHRHGERSIVAGPVAMAIAFVAVLVMGAVLADFLSGVEGTRRDVDNRVAIWRATLAAIADRPILGHGAGAFAQVIPAYFDEVPQLRTIRQAHNTWLEFIAELGLPVAALWFAALYALMRRITSAAFRRRRYGVPAAAVGAAVLVGLHALVEFSIQVPAVALVFAAVLGLAHAVARGDEGTQRAADDALPDR